MHFKTKSDKLSIASIEADQRELDFPPSGARPAASAGAGVVAAEAAGNALQTLLLLLIRMLALTAVVRIYRLLLLFLIILGASQYNMISSSLLAPTVVEELPAASGRAQSGQYD